MHTEISIIVPMYNESEGLDAFFRRVIPILNGITQHWEIIGVNDGSKDDTFARLKAYALSEPRIAVLSLSRNFGKEAALSAGIDHARGAAVIPIDADMQDPPELITEMVAKWKEGFKVVLATRRNREGDNWLKRVTALGYYRLMNHLTRIDIPYNTGDFRLMDRQVVEVVKRLPERSRFMKGLFAWVGFSSTQIFFDRPTRAYGQGKQSYFKLWHLAKDGIFAFTTMPLQLTTYTGILISVISFGWAAFYIFRTLLFGVDVPGYASIMVTILCMGGIQLVCIGIIGEYIGRIYREAKQRPLYVVEEKVNVPSSAYRQ